jgi:hypothetical protein
MSLQKINTRTTILVLMIVAAAAMRFVSYKFPYVLSNFTPVGAIALFGGAYFTDKWKGYAVVLVTLFASDVLINYLYTSQWFLWSPNSYGVYIAFALIVFVGSLIKKANVANVGIASLAAVAIHWLITDIPWESGAAALYPRTLAGYGASLVAAIPFERNMLLGDIVFCAILFGGFELAKNKYTFLRSQKELAV